MVTLILTGWGIHHFHPCRKVQRLCVWLTGWHGWLHWCIQMSVGTDDHTVLPKNPTLTVCANKVTESAQVFLTWTQCDTVPVPNMQNNRLSVLSGQMFAHVGNHKVSSRVLWAVFTHSHFWARIILNDRDQIK